MASLLTEKVALFPEQWRTAVVAIDAISLESVALAEVWNELVAERANLVDLFATPDRHFIVLEAPLPENARPKLARARLEMLERVILGEPQKVVAIDNELSPSTVAAAVTNALRALGMTTVGSRIPLPLALLVHAHRGESSVQTGRVSRFYDGRHLKIISIPRLESELETLLSPAELEVTVLRAEGLSHADIASRRGASRRTVANQVASASRKLGVSGRGNMLKYIARRERAMEH